MAKHSGCPECDATYNGGTSNGIEKQEAVAEQRSTSPAAQHGLLGTNTVFNPFYTGRPRTPANVSRHAPIDRQEIIRRIKKGESRPSSPEIERPCSRSSLKKARTTPPNDEPISRSTAEIPTSNAEAQQDNQAIGQEIERPRSALHRGDFREDPSGGYERHRETARNDAAPSLSTSPVAPWHSAFPAAALRRSQPTIPNASPPLQARPRAISHASLATSFTYQPPTSPLAQASRPDTPEPPSRQRSRSPDKSRRHTFSPTSLHRFASALEYPYSARQPPSLRSERTYPYQAHQPRRSLNAFTSLPQTPAARHRRPSLSESPLQHATMVGSYEESILRGRMSTTPSKPLNFVAQIGVLGKGDCKPSLLCPPHATVPFPAVFYSYASGMRIVDSTDQPSPYVGLIDLENNLPAASNLPGKRRLRGAATLSDDGSRASSRNREDNVTSDAQARRRKRQKQKRRSGSPRAPPGGSYRIPRQGQLQIVIKNPNKTAVKLFLVPYDLSDMEPGQKTFVRQRSYSAGPIIDMPGGTTKAPNDANERPMLRYLIHLHICCPSKGRYFLYKSVRVVFANRVPDGKERLRHEIQLPEPKYSAYRAGRESNAGLLPQTTPGPGVIAESPRRRPVYAQSLPLAEYNPQFDRPTQALPFHRSILPTLESRPASRQLSERMELDPAEVSPTHSSGSRSTLDNRFRRLDEPFDFDRDRSRERKPEAASHQSLLSKKLRDSLQFREREGMFGGE